MSTGNFVIHSSSFHSSHADWKKIPENPTMPQIAFCGRSNAGKSSLLNAILERKEIARVSATPGKTRLINYFLLNNHYFLVDLPGFGYAKASNEKRDELIDIVNGYLNHVQTLKILFVLCDAARDLPEEEKVLIETAFEKEIKPVLVRTKVDKLNQKDKARLKKETNFLEQEFPELPIFLTSTKTKMGILELRNLLTEF
ncbi:MAG TPA: ribosome biogenesis GTP-binding protein YihA/YsxC [Leptospiraceae bacterium]|nr:ribosome biogenesis GTP-binding protein YihA/YsxC [Leptospiraceae bacterium]HRG75936.1 ribosome biogenesis GTP-binding protein YihA/YsxC [Leptospiraceae bacterium]